MKLGICTSPDHLTEARELGFDYAELALSQIAALDDTSFASLKNPPLPLETFNVLFPGTFRLIEGSSDEEIRAYLDMALERTHALGGKLVVFGSGGARKVPDGIPYRSAFRRLVDIARMISDAALPYGIDIAVEPLRYAETNILNTLSEGAAFTAAVDRPNVKLLADLYHVWSNREPLSQIPVIRDFAHIHISSAGRGVPVKEELSDYQEFIHLLKGCGYDGRISIEGRIGDFRTEAESGLGVLKAIL